MVGQNKRSAQMFTLSKVYKIAYGKTVEDNDAKNAKLSYLIAVAWFLVSDPSKADLGMKMFSMIKRSSPSNILNDDEVAVVIAKMVDAIKACNNDVEKTVKSLSESTDEVAQFAGYLLAGVWNSRDARKICARSH